MPQPLLRKEEENRQSKDGLLMADLHQKGLESRPTEISSVECVGGRWELRRAPERLRRENSFEKMGQDRKNK